MFKDLKTILSHLVFWIVLLGLPIQKTSPLLGPQNVFAQESREYVLKAGFIYNFTKFIKWPEKIANEIAIDGLNLCVIGKDPFGKILTQLSQKAQSKGEKISIRRFQSSQEAPSCHILFISGSEEFQLERILDKIEGLPILLIGDTPQYAQRGVGINFYIERNKTRFEINQKAVDRRGIKISSELLNLAKIVEGREPK